MFTHHVFFWLGSDITEDDVQQFERSVTSLLRIEHVRSGDVGQPADTNRPVIERSYSYSLLLMFDSKAEHDAYQTHPVHLQFVSDCSSFWSRVQIFDTETMVR